MLGGISMHIKHKKAITTKKEKIIAKVITSEKFRRRNKKLAVYLMLKCLINFEAFSLYHHPSRYRKLVYYHSSLRRKSYWDLLLWIFEKREWRLINILEPFLNQNHLETLRIDCEDRDDKIDALSYQHYFKLLNNIQQRSCLFKIYEALLELNEELFPAKCELYSAYVYNFREPFRSEKYFCIRDPEPKLCYLFILSVIYPEVGKFVEDFGLNLIREKEKLCKILDIDKRRLKEIFKFLYVDMGLIQGFYPKITIDYFKFFKFFNKKMVLKYL